MLGRRARSVPEAAARPPAASGCRLAQEVGIAGLPSATWEKGTFHGSRASLSDCLALAPVHAAAAAGGSHAQRHRVAEAPRGPVPPHLPPPAARTRQRCPAAGPGCS
jgi:hypothetical protein